MKLLIGETIKKLRREKGLTQEELAVILGVSCQSVSRWEKDTCYPDMELLPSIAAYFGITVDKLLGIDNSIEQEKVQAYLMRFQKAVSAGDIDTCIKTAREGVAEFPNNFALLNKLMYALFLAGDEDGNIPDWKENMLRYDGEITALGERIMRDCPDPDIRCEAVARLAFNHCEQGRKEQGRAIYETLPSVWNGREPAIWWALEQEERLPNAQLLIRIGYRFMMDGMFKIIGRKLLPDEALLTVFEKQHQLEQLVYDNEEHIWNTWEKCREHIRLAQLYVRLNKYNDALRELSIAVKEAHRFDSRPERGKSHSLLLGELEWNNLHFERDDSRSCAEIMRDKWLSDTDFDPIRETEEFKQILSTLS